MLIDFARKYGLCLGIATWSSLIVLPSAVNAQALVGPCIQFLDRDGKPTHEGLKCDFSADGVIVKFFGDGSVRFSVNGVVMGAAQSNPAKTHEFTATFAGGTITGFTWMSQGKPQGNATIPAGATDFHFTSESGLSPVTFTTKGEKDTKARPPLTTVQLELFLAKQP
jgi:hypothetical protein